VLLNSPTSRVDGSSEGGRINTERLLNTLGLYGAGLVDELKARGYLGKVSVRPDFRDGIPVLVATFTEVAPKFVPRLWHGRRVIVEKEAAPPAAA
jgi:hypothetical protein